VSDAAGTDPDRPGVEELRSLFLFDQLDDDQLAWLLDQGWVERVPGGRLVYQEGDPADRFYVLLDGTVSLLRRVQGDDVEVNRTGQAGVYAGATQAYAGDRVPQVYVNSLRAVSDVRLFVLPANAFTHMVREWFPMAVHLLEGLLFGLQTTQAVVSQRERLLALGSLTAGLTHELNNPAAAAGRAAAELGGSLAAAHQHLHHLLSTPGGAPWVTAAVALEAELASDRSRPVERGPALADREDQLGEWLEDHRVPDAWEAGATLAEAGASAEQLEALARIVPDDAVPEALAWVASTVAARHLAGEVAEAVRRISALVDDARQYSQMDRAPLQEVRLDELLDSTLTMLAREVPPRVTVERDYDRSLGPIEVYAAQLNQVWTNLIENAVDAMGEEGTLTVRTRSDGMCQVVEITDTGSGIAPGDERRIFEPFFSTKPVGQGTGLGLDISWKIVVHRHGGDLTVDSGPERTTFRVSLPAARDQGAADRSGEDPDRGSPPP
jgi:signal transduction histidine kinase